MREQSGQHRKRDATPCHGRASTAGSCVAASLRHVWYTYAQTVDHRSHAFGGQQLRHVGGDLVPDYVPVGQTSQWVSRRQKAAFWIHGPIKVVDQFGRRRRHLARLLFLSLSQYRARPPRVGLSWARQI
jgi:hypothetical protein